MQPGKILDKVRERMEQVVLDPLNIEVTVEDFLSFDEVMMLVSSRFGGVLVGVTSEYAADLLSREFPPELASRPIVSYDVRVVGLDIGDEIQAVARDILNSQTSQDPRRELDQVSERVLDLDDSDPDKPVRSGTRAVPPQVVTARQYDQQALGTQLCRPGGDADARPLLSTCCGRLASV